VPFQPELAMGAIGEGGYRVLDRSLVARARISAEEVAAVEERERGVLEDRVTRFRRGRDRVDLHGRIAVVVDDGVATGSTARVAIEVARHLGAARVLLAVPVAPTEALSDGLGADDIVCVASPRPFYAVGQAYRDFTPTDDDEVVSLLDAAAQQRRGAHTAADVPDCDVDVEIPVSGVLLKGHLHVPEDATGVVVFAHGSGSSRHSPRNRYVASVLYDAGIGTLLLDLLTPEEERVRANVFDIDLLAGRLVGTLRWLARRTDTGSARLGIFGASTGAAAALVAAAQPGVDVYAVVSRGGRPDLALPWLEHVKAPTLLVVGGADTVVLGLNRQAQARLRCPNRLEVVAGATHLFEEPGTLEEAAGLARDWFTCHLTPGLAGVTELPR
jgi:putative phosphoribosyl transferase